MTEYSLQKYLQQCSNMSIEQFRELEEEDPASHGLIMFAWRLWNYKINIGGGNHSQG